MEKVREIGHPNMAQIIIDNAQACKAASVIVEGDYPRTFWTPYVVHTLNLTLKNKCAVKNTEANEITYEECNWIIDISRDVIIIKNFLMNHSMRLAMFNEHVNMKLLLSRRQNLHR